MTYTLTIIEKEGKFIPKYFEKGQPQNLNGHKVVYETKFNDRFKGFFVNQYLAKANKKGKVDTRTLDKLLH